VGASRSRSFVAERSINALVPGLPSYEQRVIRPESNGADTSRSQRRGRWPPQFAYGYDRYRLAFQPRTLTWP